MAHEVWSFRDGLFIGAYLGLLCGLAVWQIAQRLGRRERREELPPLGMWTEDPGVSRRPR